MKGEKFLTKKKEIKATKGKSLFSEGERKRFHRKGEKRKGKTRGGHALFFRRRRPRAYCCPCSASLCGAATSCVQPRTSRRGGRTGAATSAAARCAEFVLVCRIQPGRPLKLSTVVSVQSDKNFPSRMDVPTHPSSLWSICLLCDVLSSPLYYKDWWFS